jgi:hypothetical protein
MHKVKQDQTIFAVVITEVDCIFAFSPLVWYKIIFRKPLLNVVYRHSFDDSMLKENCDTHIRGYS